MNLIINHTSMEPIYEQIVAQIKAEVIEGRMTAGDALPSVRALSRELKISALTVKKAYDNLEEEGLVVTVHGKGSFIAAANQELLMEERRKELEKELEAVGISVEVKKLAWGDFADALKNREFDLYLGEVKLTANFDLTELITEEGNLPLSPGKAVFVKEEEMHRFKNTGEGAFKFLCIVPNEGHK